MNQSILITGCSTGIGLCVAKDLHKLGFQVFATCRDPKDVEKLKSIGLTGLQLDVTNSKSITAALNIILNQTGGKLDILFNNAGYGQMGAVEDLTKEAMQQQFNTNVFGLLDLTNQVIPVMREQGHGKIIATSSILGFIPMRYRGAYVSSKFALEGLYNTLRLELLNTNIKVSLIQPGPIETKFRDNSYNVFNNHIDPVTSPHSTQYKNMQKHYEPNKSNKIDSKPQNKNNIFTLPPEAITKIILKIITSNNPRARYSVTFPTYLFHILVRILPMLVLEKIFYQITESEVK